MHYVVRHGRRIAVEELETNAPPARHRKEPSRNLFVMAPFGWMRRACKATRTPKAFVCIWLLHRAWKTKSNTVVVSNLLRDHGVNRSTKVRALHELEEEGLIKVVWNGRRAPVVTLLL